MLELTAKCPIASIDYNISKVFTQIVQAVICLSPQHMVRSQFSLKTEKSKVNNRHPK